MELRDLTARILKACFEVSNELGCGYLESVYEKSLIIALWEEGLSSQSQVSLQVNFRGRSVGEFIADMVVEGRVLLELKATKSLTPEHIAQVLNYLKITGFPIGMLINFGNAKLEYRRFNNYLTVMKS